MSSDNTKNNPNSEQTKKTRTQIIAILCIAALIIAIASIFIFEKNEVENKKNKEQEQISAEFEKHLNENQKKRDKINQKQEELQKELEESNEEIKNELEENQNGSDATKSEQNLTFVGSYKCVGYDNEVVIELHDDNTVSVVSQNIKGWWLIKKIDNINVLAMVFEHSQEPEYFQIYGSRLLDIRSIYTGDVTIGAPFNSTLTMGDMTLTLKDNGKVEGRHMTTLDDGSGYQYPEVYGGSYTVDGEYIDITLAGDSNRFLMFDYNDGSELSGIASLYYEKIN